MHSTMRLTATFRRRRAQRCPLLQLAAPNHPQHARPRLLFELLDLMQLPRRPRRGGRRRRRLRGLAASTRLRLQLVQPSLRPPQLAALAMTTLSMRLLAWLLSPLPPPPARLRKRRPSMTLRPPSTTLDRLFPQAALQTAPPRPPLALTTTRSTRTSPSSRPSPLAVPLLPAPRRGLRRSRLRLMRSPTLTRRSVARPKTQQPPLRLLRLPRIFLTSTLTTPSTRSTRRPARAAAPRLRPVATRHTPRRLSRRAPAGRLHQRRLPGTVLRLPWQTMPGKSSS